MRLLTLALFCAPFVLSAQIAERVFQNGKIYTANENQEFVEAVAIDSGNIIFAGTTADVQQHIGGGTWVHDLEGKVMLPGLHDVHIHLLEASSDAWGFCWINVNAGSLDAMAYNFYNCGPEANENGWIISFGFNIDDLLESEIPPNEVLDAYFPTTPVYIMENTSHSAWVNSAALEELGFTSTSSDPQGGHIVMDSETGDPNGILLDNAGDIAFHMALAASNQQDIDNYNGLIYFGFPSITEQGITSLCEGRTYWKRDYIETWQQLHDDGELPARVVLAPWGYPEDEDEDQIPALLDLYDEGDDMLRVHQIKVYMDGIAINGTAALDQPYVYSFGWPFDQGLNYFTPERLEDYITQLETEGFDFHIHAIGNRGVTEALDAIEGARANNGDIGARHRITHLEFVNSEDYARFAELNVTADMQVGNNWSNPNNWPDNIPIVGEELASVIVPVKSLFDEGARVTLSSDWDAGNMNPFRGIRNAMQRDPENLPTVEDAVDCYTINGAYVMRQEDVTGSVEVGKFADLICIDRDIFTIPFGEIGQTQVTMTMLGGDIIYSDNEFPNGIDNSHVRTAMSVSPTASSTYFSIKLPHTVTNNAVIAVHSTSGELVATYSTNDSSNLTVIPIGDWAEGMYVITCNDPMSGFVGSKKVVVYR